jgi:hypothetical protein
MSAQDNFLMQLQAEEQRSKRSADLWRKKKDKEQEELHEAYSENNQLKLMLQYLQTTANRS